MAIDRIGYYSEPAELGVQTQFSCADIRTKHRSGGSETGDKHYTHKQTTASARWEVHHGLNKFPSATVVDSAGSVVVGDVQHIDKNNIVLTFSGAFSGTAYFN